MYRGEISEIDEESPLSSHSDGTESSIHVDTFGGASVNKDFEQSPVLLSPGGMAEIKHAARLLYLIWILYLLFCVIFVAGQSTFTSTYMLMVVLLQGITCKCDILYL